MQTWVSLIHAATHLRAGLEKRFREELSFGLSEQDLLKQLYVNHGELTLTELSRRIYFSKAGLTKMLDRLEASGFVKREPVPQDRRAVRARLTAKGEAAFAKSRSILGDYVQSALRDRLNDTELLALKDSLETLLTAHGVWDGQQRHLRGGSDD